MIASGKVAVKYQVITLNTGGAGGAVGGTTPPVGGVPGGGQNTVAPAPSPSGPIVSDAGIGLFYTTFVCLFIFFAVRKGREIKKEMKRREAQKGQRSGAP